MKISSSKKAPMFMCHIILEKQDDAYLIRKHSSEPNLVGKLVTQQDCDDYLDSDLLVCVILNYSEPFGTNVYNFDIEDANKSQL
jgi:hypothetical protein